MDPFTNAPWYTGTQNLESIPQGSILLIIDRGCYWSQKKAPMFIKFSQKLKQKASNVNMYMIDYDTWFSFPDIEGFPTLTVKTKQNGLVKIGPSENFTNDVANALKLALQNQ
jgi:hypothetical protein